MQHRRPCETCSRHSINRQGSGPIPRSVICHFPIPILYRYPLVYMHGRSTFELSSAEIEGLRTYLSRGGVLLADACCGAKGFDESFRAAMKKPPATPLTRIPVTHEVFSAKSGQDVTRIRRRVNSSLPGQAVKSQVLEGERTSKRSRLMDDGSDLQQSTTSVALGTGNQRSVAKGTFPKMPSSWRSILSFMPCHRRFPYLPNWPIQHLDRTSRSRVPRLDRVESSPQSFREGCAEGKFFSICWR